MDAACREDRRALSACLEEEGGTDVEGKCVPQQRRHALCVASFKCPQVRYFQGASLIALGGTNGVDDCR